MNEPERHAAEVREIVKRAKKQGRKAGGWMNQYLGMVVKARGQAAADKLREDARSVWK